MIGLLIVSKFGGGTLIRLICLNPSVICLSNYLRSLCANITLLNTVHPYTIVRRITLNQTQIIGGEMDIETQRTFHGKECTNKWTTVLISTIF